MQACTGLNCFGQSVNSYIEHDLGVNPVAAFDYAEDDGLAAYTAVEFSAYTTWTEVGIIDFYFPLEGALGFTMLWDASSEFEEDVVDSTDRESG